MHFHCRKSSRPREQRTPVALPVMYPVPHPEVDRISESLNLRDKLILRHYFRGKEAGNLTTLPLSIAPLFFSSFSSSALLMRVPVCNTHVANLILFFFCAIYSVSPCLETGRAVHTPWSYVRRDAWRTKRGHNIPIHYTNRRNSITWRSTCHVWPAPFASAIMRKETPAKIRSARGQIYTSEITKLPEDNRIWQ